jgi:hypothetical protein
MTNNLKLGVIFYFICLNALLSWQCRIPTYYETQKAARTEWTNKKYSEALKQLDKNSYLTKNYNNHLYHIEKARLLELNGNCKEAVELLNKVDLDLDSWDKLKVRNSNGSIFIAKTGYSLNEKFDSLKGPNRFQSTQYNKVFFKRYS